jgi:SAM-dependent methyltransferase
MPPEFISDQNYLREDQYKHAGNLNARIALHERFSLNRVGWAAWAFDQWRGLLPPRARVLEVGCGSAYLWQHNRDRIPPGWRVTLTDFSPGMLTSAQASLGEDAARFTWAEADAQALPFADGDFDAVIAHHMLYHVPDRARAYAEFRRVLAPGGLVVAALNGEDHLREITELVAEDYPTAVLPGSSANKTLPTEKAAREMQAVFTRIEVRPYEDGLEVTEAGPLVDYVWSDFHYRLAERDEFARFVAQRLERDGVIRIRKDTALIVART